MSVIDEFVRRLPAPPLGGGVMLGSSSGDSDMNLRPGTCHAYVVTDDPDALFGHPR